MMSESDSGIPNGASEGGLPSHTFKYLESVVGVRALSDLKVGHLKSAQQRVWLLENLKPATSDALPPAWQMALKMGNNRLVVRQWKASSCFWNLNRNLQSYNALLLLARSEVAGYRISRKALPEINIPDVLYFSHDNYDNNKSNELNIEIVKTPWAILAYVGQGSTLFDTEWRPDHSWMDGMIKTRFEFGFEEPHPRWGRVSDDACVDYTKSVLHHVTLPLHRYMRSNQTSITAETNALRAPKAATHFGFTYSTMVDIYRKEQGQMKQAMVSHSNDPTLQAAMDLLEQAINHLTEQQPYSKEPLQPLVLCHMDCQPQNLLFAQSVANKEQGSCPKPLPRISSVLDWEEAALADPRFELLLMCRKVCANREQAEEIWKIYEEQCPQPDLGPLQPWLALETVHSLSSLLLQSMDLLGGGRSPWESKPDLQGKIKREIRRLVLEIGWTFCDIPEFR